MLMQYRLLSLYFNMHCIHIHTKGRLFRMNLTEISQTVGDVWTAADVLMSADHVM